MSLQELTFESPQYFEGLEGRGETRFFLTTNLAAVPSRGDVLTAPFSSGLICNSINWQPSGAHDGINIEYRVAVNGVPELYYDAEPDAEEEEEGFEATLEEITLKEIESGDLVQTVEDASGYPRTFFMPRFIYYITKYISATSVSGLTSVLAKTGMVNLGANDPFTGAGIKLWMCIGTPMDKVGRNRWKITYRYQHAGYDEEGNERNWEDIAKEQGFTIRTGVIGP